MHLVRTIHHFDDQPEFVRWICGALRNRYGMTSPEWLVPGGIDDTDEWESRFDLQIGSKTWTIAHRLYGTPEQFRAEFPGRARTGDVALIDLMVGGEENTTEFAGAALYSEAIERLGADSVYFLTAYPRYLESLPEYRHAQVIIKPPDVTKLVGSIIAHLTLAETS